MTLLNVSHQVYSYLGYHSEVTNAGINEESGLKQIRAKKSYEPSDNRAISSSVVDDPLGTILVLQDTSLVRVQTRLFSNQNSKRNGVDNVSLLTWFFQLFFVCAPMCIAGKSWEHPHATEEKYSHQIPDRMAIFAFIVELHHLIDCCLTEAGRVSWGCQN